MVKAVILFAIGLVLLIKGGDWFVDGSVGIAHRYHIPEILIGATVVSIGTTIPEVMVSSMAAAKGAEFAATAYGNAIGSIICNTSLIAALTYAIRPQKVQTKSLNFPVACFFVAAAFYCAVALFKGRFDRIDGIILLCMFLIYMAISVRKAFKEPALEVQEEEESKDEKIGKSILLLVAGAAAIALGANFLVDNGKIIAEGLGVPESVIALTFVALGTSLPELITAITSLAKGHSSLSLGNIIGANLFNLVLVSGLSVTINPYPVPVEKTVAGLNASFVIDIPLMVLVMLLMVLPTLLKKKLARWQGITLLVLYFSYITFQFFI